MTTIGHAIGHFIEPSRAARAVIVMAVVAAVAAWIPARHAARIDPLIALRAD